jgi:mannose-1-phosphate guanylyltransferase
MSDRLWAIVLAGGEGSRLGALARDEYGDPAPKQFCHFGTERSLLASTLARAQCLVPRDRVVVSLLDHHRRWWAGALADRPARNAVSQPCPRGTAAGVLAPLLRIRRADPDARVVILPSDHAFEDEATLIEALAGSVRVAERRPEDVILLGFAPEGADPTLGWIVPSPDRDASSQGVLAFEEKPGPGRATELMASGGMWNGMLIVARVSALVRLYERHLPELIPGAAELDRSPGGSRCPAAAYLAMPTRDLSRDLIARAVGRLRVVRVPPCGWTDLGTPARLLKWQVAHGAMYSDPAVRSA